MSITPLFNRIFRNFFLNPIVSSTASSKKLIINSELDNLANPIESVYRLIYRYEDASLPPEFHRSYTINVMNEKIHISIDSYHKVLGKKSLPITKTKYQSFVAAILGLNIKVREEVKSNGCTGGTSDKLDIYIGKDYEVKGYIYHCGNENFGNLEGNVGKAVELFKALIPNLKNRINDSKK